MAISKTSLFVSKLFNGDLKSPSLRKSKTADSSSGQPSSVATHHVQGRVLSRTRAPLKAFSGTVRSWSFTPDTKHPRDNNEEEPGHRLTSTFRSRSQTPAFSSVATSESPAYIYSSLELEDERERRNALLEREGPARVAAIPDTATTLSSDDHHQHEIDIPTRIDSGRGYDDDDASEPSVYSEDSWVSSPSSDIMGGGAILSTTAHETVGNISRLTNLLASLSDSVLDRSTSSRGIGGGGSEDGPDYDGAESDVSDASSLSILSM